MLEIFCFAVYWDDLNMFFSKEFLTLYHHRPTKKFHSNKKNVIYTKLLLTKKNGDLTGTKC